jgi:luciferase family oxidoreductase group 1
VTNTGSASDAGSRPRDVAAAEVTAAGRPAADQITARPHGSAPVPMSILELAGVGVGSTPAAALADSTELARAAEQWGYHRFWVAEHHGMPAVASASPPVLIAHLAAHTSRIRLGSGGVMLPNHAPLVVAEQFGTLAALHPGRIDLGLGRAPGTDQLTTFALRRRSGNTDPDDFPDRLAELRHFLRHDFPDGHPFAAIKATPMADVPVWLLGSSDFSARLAARLGLPFAFAHHFAGAGGNTGIALDIYRSEFRPSDVLRQPWSMIGVTALAADTGAEARYQARAGALSMVLLRSGRLQQTPTPEQAAEYPYSQSELDLIAAISGTEVVGTPDAVADGIRRLVKDFGVDEVMITTRVHGAATRLRSFELIAGQWA